MAFDIRIGKYKLCMIDKVEIHRSVELQADTAVITLPASEYNKALQIEDKLHRGDKVIITIGYRSRDLKRSSRDGFSAYRPTEGTSSFIVKMTSFSSERKSETRF